MHDHGSSPATCVFTCVIPVVIPTETVKVSWRLAICVFPPFVCVFDGYFFFGSTLLTRILCCQSLYRALLLCNKLNQLVLPATYMSIITVQVYFGLAALSVSSEEICHSWFCWARTKFYNCFCVSNMYSLQIEKLSSSELTFQPFSDIIWNVVYFWREPRAELQVFLH